MRTFLDGLNHHKIRRGDIATVFGIAVDNDAGATTDDDAEKHSNALEITDAPRILWHYTSLDAFQKILNTGEIFATHYAFLDDYDEIQTVSKAIYDGLVAREKLSRNSYFKQFCSYINKKFPCGSRRDNIISREGQGDGSFIISLSEMQDSIPHWKEYTQDWGVSIGFRVKRGLVGFGFREGIFDSLIVVEADNRCMFHGVSAAA